MVDNKNRKVVHFRWLEECVHNNIIIDQELAMHLCPFPQKVPVSEFEQVSIAFSQLKMCE